MIRILQGILDLKYGIIVKYLLKVVASTGMGSVEPPTQFRRCL